MTKQSAEEFQARPVSFIADPLATTEWCRYSLMCRHVCPVGHVTHRESLTPHGWALLIASVRRRLLEWNDETIDILYQCADCGLCQAHCATRQPLPTAIAAARAEVVEQGRAPEAVRNYDALLQQWGNAFGRPISQEPLASGPLGLFAGDAACFGHPASLDALLKLLRRTGEDPVLIGRGRSAGLEATSLGLWETAGRFARQVIEEVHASQCRRLLVLSPGDRYAFTVAYQERLNLEWPSETEVVDAVDFLDQAIEQGRLSLTPLEAPASFAYHDPCHAARMKRNHDAPRRLLERCWGRLPRPVFWREGRSHPCGAVGALNRIQPGLAARLSQARLQDAAQAGAGVLVTEDPQCLNELSKASQSFQSSQSSESSQSSKSPESPERFGSPLLSPTIQTIPTISTIGTLETLEICGLFELLASAID